MKLQFDTRAVKPKLFYLIIIAAMAVAAELILLSAESPARIRMAVIVLVLFFLALIFALLNAFLKQLQYNPYSYNTIIYAGFGLFCLFLLVTHIYLAARCFDESQIITRKHIFYVLFYSAKNYMILTAPFLLVFSIFLFASNVSLIRHEGRRFVNILGILLSVLLITGEAAVIFVDYMAGAFSLEYLSDAFSKEAVRKVLETITGNNSVSRVNAAQSDILQTITGLVAVLYLYFECMIIGTIIADAIVIRYVPERNKDFLIILGCGIRKDGTPTPLLKGRVDLAKGFRNRQLQETGKPAAFVVSGGQGPDEVQSEAASMRDYLITQGVRPEEIITEDQSKSTAENMRFSKEKIDAVNPNAQVAYFTTNYHVFRAGLKARRVKMRAQGMGAKTRWYFWPNAAVREFVGLITEHRLKQGLLLGGLMLGYLLLSFQV